jgi:hypothetical protein
LNTKTCFYLGAFAVPFSSHLLLLGVLHRDLPDFLSSQKPPAITLLLRPLLYHVPHHKKDDILIYALITTDLD